MRHGDKVIATFPDGHQSDVGEIIEGPIFRNNTAVFKVRYTDFDNWVWADWLKPFLQDVNEK